MRLPTFNKHLCSYTLILTTGAEDKTLIIWETKRGLALTSLALHVPLLGFQITSDCARIVVHLLDRGMLPLNLIINIYLYS